MADFTVEGIIDVDSSKAIKTLTSFQTKLRSVTKDVKALDTAIDRVDGRTLKIKVDSKPIDKLRADLDSIRDETVKIKADTTGTGEALSEMEELEASIRAISHDDVETKVVLAGAAKAIADAEKIHTELEAVARPINIPVKVDQKPLRELLSNVDLAKGGIGGPSAGTGTLVGAIMAIAPALAPIGAVSAGVLGGFVSSISVATAGVAGFGIVAIPTIKKISDGIKLLNKDTSDMSTEELAKYNEEVAKFKQGNPEIQKAISNFNKLKSSYMALNKVIQPHVIAIFNNGLKIGNTLLQSLAPMVDKSGRALAVLSKEMSQAFKGDEWQTFFDYLNKNSGKFIKVWGRTVGNFVTGIANMIVAFDPLTKFFNKGLLGMSEDFRKWSENLSKNKGFQKFVDYVKENGPKVKALLGSIIRAIIQLGIAFAPLGSKILDGAIKVFDAITNFAKKYPQVTSMAVAIGGLGIALAPLVGPLTSVVGPLVEVASVLGASGAAVAGAVALAAAFWAMAGALAFTNKETPEYAEMMKKIGKLWDTIKQAGQELGDVAKDMWEKLNNSSAVANFQEAFGHMASVITQLMPVLKPLATILGTVLVAAIIAFAAALNTLWTALDKAVSIVSGTVKAIVRFFQWLYDVLIGHSIIPDLINGIRAWFGKLRGFIMGPVNAVRGKVVAAFQFMKSKITGIAQSIVGTVRDKFNAAKNAVSGAVAATRNAVTKGFSAVLGAVKSKVSQVPGIARNAFNNAKSAVSTATSAIVTTARTKFAEVVNAARTKLGEVKGAVTGAFSGAGSWLLSAGSSIMGGLISGIGSRVGELTSKLGGITNLIPKVKGPKSKDKKLLVPTGKWIMDGLIQGLSTGSEGVFGMLGKLTSKIATFYNKKFKNDKVADAYTKSAIKLLKWQYKNMVDVGKIQDRLAAKIKNQIDLINEMKDAQKAYAQAVKEGVIATGNITGLGSRQDANGNEIPKTATSIGDDLRQKVKDAEEFQKLIDQLTRSGLNKTSLDDLIQAGVDGGLETARALAAGGDAALKDINASMAKLAQIGQKLGTDTSKTMYDAGIRAAEGVLAGLKQQEKALNAYMRYLSKNLSASIHIILNGGKGGGKGGKGGKGGGKGGVGASIVGGFNEAGRSSAAPPSNQRVTQNSYTINVKAVAPNAEVGRAIAKALEEFERAGGRKKK